MYFYLLMNKDFIIIIIITKILFSFLGRLPHTIPAIATLLIK